MLNLGRTSELVKVKPLCYIKDQTHSWVGWVGGLVRYGLRSLCCLDYRPGLYAWVPVTYSPEVVGGKAGHTPSWAVSIAIQSHPQALLSESVSLPSAPKEGQEKVVIHFKALRY